MNLYRIQLSVFYVRITVVLLNKYELKKQVISLKLPVIWIKNEKTFCL